jgi:hypothetical protein
MPGVSSPRRTRSWFRFIQQCTQRTAQLMRFRCENLVASLSLDFVDYDWNESMRTDGECD